MNELSVIYRACPLELDNHKPGRPAFFDKEKCYKSFYNSFAHKSDIHIVWDGNTDNRLYKCIEQTSHSVKIHQINVKNNQRSLEYCYDLAYKLPNPYVYFCEDDYMYLPNSYEFMIDALKLGYNPLTLYEHLDRFLFDDVTKLYVGGTDETIGQDYIGLTKFGRVRTVESTTCSFACSKNLFDYIKDHLYRFNTDGIGAPLDRPLWRYVNSNLNIRLWSAIPGLACHMVLPLTPFIDWN